MDYKKIIIEELTILKKKEQQDGNIFKVKAYKNAITSIENLDTVSSIEDLEGVKGIGKSIKEKIIEIFETGKLEATKDLKEQFKGSNVVEQLMNVYGIGRVKANKLKREGITSIEDLRKKSEEDPKLLNKNQKVGLLHYEDLLLRIPRNEMEKHEKKVFKLLSQVSPSLEGVIVGSYRRGLESSGDIDVLIKWSKSSSFAEGKRTLKKIVEYMIEKKYVTDVLVQGDKKFMGVSKISKDGKARRLDILLTPEKEFGFAVLYFTGSDNFNVALRSVALKKGYSMNEHGFTPKEGVEPAPELKTEEEILNFLGFNMIEPKLRVDETILDKNKIKSS